jgi:hypothetical protein
VGGSCWYWLLIFVIAETNNNSKTRQVKKPTECSHLAMCAPLQPCFIGAIHHTEYNAMSNQIIWI